MSEKCKKIVSFIIWLATAFSGLAGVLKQFTVATAPSLNAGDVITTNWFLGGALGLGVLAIIYGKFGHDLIVKLFDWIASWWRGAGVDPRAGELLRFGMLTGLKEFWIDDKVWQAKIDDAALYASTKQVSKDFPSVAAKASTLLSLPPV